MRPPAQAVVSHRSTSPVSDMISVGDSYTIIHCDRYDYFRCALIGRIQQGLEGMAGIYIGLYR